jgi:nucleotide-binding universal stress UspA family protein
MSSSIFNRIVVGVDGRDGGQDALVLAGTLQRAGGGEIVAVYVYPYDRSVTVEGADESEAALTQELQATLEHEVAKAGVRARSVVMEDPSAARALQTYAEVEHADLIVVGAPHRQGADRVLGGDVAAGTLHGAPCAVAVAPPGYRDRPAPLRTIGAGFDDTPEARSALALARRIALAADATVRAYTVVSRGLAVRPPPAGYVEWWGVKNAARERARKTLRAALAEIGDDSAGYPIAGNPADELARRSGHLDLLVLGSRSHGPVRRLLLGSTSRRLVREARCPLLVLPRGARAPAQTDPASAAAAT